MLCIGPATTRAAVTLQGGSRGRLRARVAFPRSPPRTHLCSRAARSRLPLRSPPRCPHKPVAAAADASSARRNILRLQEIRCAAHPRAPPSGVSSPLCARQRRPSSRRLRVLRQAAQKPSQGRARRRTGEQQSWWWWWWWCALCGGGGGMRRLWRQRAGCGARWSRSGFMRPRALACPSCARLPPPRPALLVCPPCSLPLCRPRWRWAHRAEGDQERDVEPWVPAVG